MTRTGGGLEHIGATEGHPVSLGSAPADGCRCQHTWGLRLLATLPAINRTASRCRAPDPDVEPPRWTDVRQSLQNVTPGQSVLLYARLEDDRGLATAILATNETGEWRNWTGRYSSPQVLRDETSAWVVFSWKNASVANGTRVGWKIWFSDSSGRWNSTSERSFEIQARQRFLPNRTPSNTIFVPNAACGVPFQPTITLAIQAAGSLEPIIVCPGTYVESVVIDKNVVLRGRDGPASTIIDARTLSTAVQITSPEPLATITGFTLRHSDFGVHISGNDAVVENVVLDEAGALGAGPNRGVHVDPGVTRARINFTQSNGNRASVGAFVSENAQRVNITNSSFSNHAIGIHVQGLDGFPSRFINITNVTVNSSNETGILLEFSDDTNVTNSRFVNFNRTGLLSTGQNVTALRARGANSGLNVTGNVIDNISCVICSALGIDIDGIAPNGTVLGPASSVVVRGNV
ncbi:MAG: right-handed parallel beta-helix repeat-containing protein [Halobacteria archaeon]